MSRFTQIREITLMNLRSIPERLAPSLVIVIGIAGVVGVLVALLSMSAGLGQTLGSTGEPDQVVVSRGGSQGEIASFLAVASMTLVKQDPAIARGPDGLPLASGELIVITEVPRPGQDTGANVSLRGIEPVGLALRPKFRLVQGRMFRPGVQEIIVGIGASRQFSGLEVGRELRFRGGRWTIVGHFESGGAYDSELWTDRETAQGAFGRPGVSSILARIKDPGLLPAMEARLKADPQLDVDVRSQDAFFAGQSGNLTVIIGALAGIVATIMGVGAVFGALNTMYSAVSARTKEIGTRKALGARRRTILLQFLIEAVSICLIGGLVGLGVTLAASLVLATLLPALPIAFSPGLMAVSVLVSILTGVVSGFAPAWGASRLDPVVALRYE